MSDKTFTIRTMSRPEIDLALDWAANEGWNPGKTDGDSFHTADPEGFLVGLLDEEPVACLSAVRYEKGFGFIGFYIVKPDYRGQGYGSRIWQEGLNRLQGGAVGLDGVLAQQKFYEKSGFRLAFRNLRQAGPGGGSMPQVNGLVNLLEIPESQLIIYDRRHFPALRQDFLLPWIRQPGTQAMGIIQAGKLSGYGVIRPCREGWKIGPLFADTPQHADALFLALRSRVPAADTLFLDTPEPNAEALALAARYRMKPVFETVRMYLLRQPQLPLEHIYGITSFELG